MSEARPAPVGQARWRRPHYAWVVLACAMAVATVTSGIRLSFGVFIDPLVEKYGWSRGEISVAYALIFLSAASLTPVAGWLADRYGARRIILAGAVLFTLGMVLTGTATQLWQFYVYYGVILGGLGTTMFTMLLPVILTRWFHARLGVAIGLLWVSVGVGPVILPLLLRGVIAGVGWQQAFLLVGIPTGLVILLSGVFLRERPQDVGLAAYGQSAEEAQQGAAGQPAPAVTLATVRANRSFWCLVLVHFMGCAGHSILLAHTVSMATVTGHVPGLVAAGLLSVISAASIVSRFSMSIMTEKSGGRWTLTLALLLQTTPVLMLLWAHETWSFYLFAVLFGLGYGGEMVGFPIINRQLYGDRAPLNSIYAWEMSGAMLGMAFGGWLGGALFDLSGAYTWSVIAALAFGYAGLVPVLLLPVHRPGRLVVAPAPAGGAR